MSEVDNLDLQDWFIGLNEETQHVLITKAAEEDSTGFTSLVEMMLKSKSYDREQIPSFLVFVKSLADDGKPKGDKSKQNKAADDSAPKKTPAKTKTTNESKDTTDKKKTTKDNDNKKLSDKKLTANANQRSKSQGSVPPVKTKETLKSPKSGAAKDKKKSTAFTQSCGQK